MTSQEKPSIAILSIFPETIQSVLNTSILRRAQLKDKVLLEAIDLRQYSGGKFKSVDDTPFGGNQGMLFKVEVLHKALSAELERVGGDRSRLCVIYTSPKGLRLEQPIAERMSQWLLEEKSSTEKNGAHNSPRRLVIVCGRYEGVDERFIENWVDIELSLGDFILSGGELVALAFLDAVVRLLPGVLGDQRSAREDTFSNGLLEYPQYTKPRDFLGRGVPEELYSGHHQRIQEWQLRQSLLCTFAFRPDLIRAHSGELLAPWAQEMLRILKLRLDVRTKSGIKA